MKKRVMKCWAVWHNNDGKMEYLPELFSSRSDARKFQKSSYPTAHVIQVVIRAIPK